MALIYDGIRVFNPAAGGVILAQDHQDFQDQMILGMEERTIPIPVLTASAIETTGPAWAYQTMNAVNPPYIMHNNAAGGETVECTLPYLPEATKLTEISVIINGSAAAAEGGSIDLYEATRTTAIGAYAVKYVIDNTDPWTLAGVVTKITQSGLSGEPSNQTHYHLVFEAATAAVARNMRIYHAEYKAWFHKGT